MVELRQNQTICLKCKISTDFIRPTGLAESRKQTLHAKSLQLYFAVLRFPRREQPVLRGQREMLAVCTVQDAPASSDRRVILDMTFFVVCVSGWFGQWRVTILWKCGIGTCPSLAMSIVTGMKDGNFKWELPALLVDLPGCPRSADQVHVGFPHQHQLFVSAATSIGPSGC